MFAQLTFSSSVNRFFCRLAVRSRLSAIRARIVAQQAKCSALEQEGSDGGGGKTVAAAAAAGGSSWPPSKARVKLAFLEMQEEGMLLRSGGVQGARDIIRGAPAAASSNGTSGARKAAGKKKKKGPAAASASDGGGSENAGGVKRGRGRPRKAAAGKAAAAAASASGAAEKTDTANGGRAGVSRGAGAGAETAPKGEAANASPLKDGAVTAAKARGDQPEATAQGVASPEAAHGGRDVTDDDGDDGSSGVRPEERSRPSKVDTPSPREKELGRRRGTRSSSPGSDVKDKDRKGKREGDVKDKESMGRKDNGEADGKVNGVANKSGSASPRRQCDANPPSRSSEPVTVAAAVSRSPSSVASPAGTVKGAGREESRSRGRRRERSESRRQRRSPSWDSRQRQRRRRGDERRRLRRDSRSSSRGGESPYSPLSSRPAAAAEDRRRRRRDDSRENGRSRKGRRDESRSESRRRRHRRRRDDSRSSSGSRSRSRSSAYSRSCHRRRSGSRDRPRQDRSRGDSRDGGGRTREKLGREEARGDSRRRRREEENHHRSPSRRRSSESAARGSRKESGMDRSHGLSSHGRRDVGARHGSSRSRRERHRSRDNGSQDRDRSGGSSVPRRGYKDKKEGVPSPSPAAAETRAAIPDSGGVVAGLKISGGEGVFALSRSSVGERRKTRGPSRSPPVASPARNTATAADHGGGEDSHSEWSDVSDSEVKGIRNLRKRHGDDWRGVLGVEADERLGLEVVAVKVENNQLSGVLPPSEDPAKRPRQIMSVMITKASRKLPRAVHRQILDTFQVVILEPYYYPLNCKVRERSV